MPEKPATRTKPRKATAGRKAPRTLPAQRELEDVSSVPRLPRVYVPRARLWTRLEDVTNHGVTLLVAPVGAGKTLGVAGWLRTSGQAGRTTWIQGDASWSAARLEKLLGTSTSSAGATRNLLVIDDAQQLPTPSLRLLDDRLVNSPEGLRILLISRWDLPLTRLVPELMGDFSVLRGDVLRMDEDEAVPLITEHARTDHPEVVRSVIDRANGWVAAVVLASRSIAATPDAVATARRYARGNASIADRLVSEVFAALQPRERHLLLCVANEEVVTTEQAVHLSHDARAGEVLAGLETTGLLVTRLPDTDATSDDPDPAAGVEDSARFRIHPLLIETVRRRLFAGGVDVARAQSTILRAVRLDLARGETERAFVRLVAANEPDQAAKVLADEGVTMLLRGHGDAIAAFARTHPDAVDATPSTWFALALERWLDNDSTGTAHWLDRVVEWAETLEKPDELCPQMACARLLRARMGGEPMDAAIGHARRVVLAQMTASAPGPLLPLLIAELGMAQAWLGELGEAEVNLTTAISLSRAQGLGSLTAAALSHLALTLFMQGRESACIEIAEAALQQLPANESARAFVRARALLARQLATLCDVPWPTGESAQDAPASSSVPLHIGDPVARFWVHLREARLALMSGSVSGAEQVLEVPPTWFAMPDHLRVTLIIERGFLASLAGDAQALRSWSTELESLGARGEAELLTGLRLELESDRKAALAAYERAQEDVTYSQPPSRALALTCEAQLLDVLGRPDDAIDRLRTAATLTEVRRNAVPFLGWSRQGTPIETLLARLAADTPTAWIKEVAAAAQGKPDIATVFAPMTATPRERTKVSDPTVRPSLSAREREVLNELARGATYADIAAELFVSENTVKTHVSSLYSKLAVTRRSEALAVARNLHLL
jgi:LuxR family transcriptional regulator, maltose regulon positive regulatory protein